MVHLVGALGNRAGLIDGITEAGAALGDCHKDKWDVALSLGVAGSNLASHIRPDKWGPYGGLYAAAFALTGVIRNGKITWNDLATIGAGVAGFLAGGKSPLALARFTPLGMVLNVAGLALTLYDLYNGRGKDTCYYPPKRPPSMADAVPRKGRPNKTPAEAINSPLVIDVDGNGIKTVSINKNVFFDLDNNLFAEKTGWVEQGDALLVWDRDRNGKIDAGNELFGNHTLLKNGKKASNGFEALSELDSNNDKIFDEKDDAWATLQLWFDRNQNGISEQDELIDLAKSGIKSIRLDYQNINHVDDNGNSHLQTSSVTWEGGKTTEINDVWLRTDPGLSYFREEIHINDQIKDLPDIEGLGNVLNLHSAMAKNPALQKILEQYMRASDAEREDLLLPLIYKWTGVEDINENSRGQYFNGRKLAVLEAVIGSKFNQYDSLSGPSDPHKNSAGLLEEEFNKFVRYVFGQIESKTLYKDIFTITHFNVNEETGELEFDWSKINNAIEQAIQENNLGEAKRIHSIARNLGAYNDDYLAVADKNFKALSQNNKTLASLLDLDFIQSSELQKIAIGTDKNELLSGSFKDETLKAGYGHDMLIGKEGNDLLQGGAGSDTYVFSKGHGQDIIREEGHWSWIPNDIDTIRFTDVNYADVKFRQVGNDLLLLGYHGDDSITIKDHYSGDKKNQIEKFEFLDRTLTLKEMQEEGMKFVGTAGNDVISQNTKVILDGGAGNDTLTGSSDDDILIGGTGNDMLNGGIGADTYIVSKGHGHDIIQEKGYWMRLNEQDTLQFTDVKYDEVRFRRIRDNLMLHGYNPNDAVTIRNFFADADNQIENFQFSDRTLTVKQMKEEGMTLVGTSGKDEIMAWGDKCTIDSGLGNDVLIGSSGAETYLFRRGHGKDVIQPVDGTSDTIRFVGIHSSKVNFERVGNDLILSGYHKTDSVTVKDFYAKTVNQISNFVFSDRTLSLAQLKQNGVKIFGTDGNDVINDDAEASIINAGKGDDIINAGDGNDTLIGGEGNDILNGAHGNDTYIFGAGHGKDVIHDENYWMHLNNKDVMRFTDITDPKKLWFSRQGSNLLIQELGTQDSVTVSNWFNGKENQIEEIRLANEKALYAAQVNKMIEAMASFGAQYGGDINLAPKEEVNAYLDKIAVGSYWG